jgi:molybdopterin-guanine dinucleotide biosynthesis protein A
MTKIKNLYGLILAGGFSRRMGQDKSLMVYHGKPQIEYIQELLTEFCTKVFLSKRLDQQTYKNITVINDDPDFSGNGPLGGILSAMKTYPEASWLVIACDIPFVTKETLHFLIENRSFKKLATAFKSTYDGLPEPLCAIWESHAYSEILDLFKNDIHCPRKVLIKSDIQLIEQQDPKWLDNVNDLKEFEQALSYLKTYYAKQSDPATS